MMSRYLSLSGRRSATILKRGFSLIELMIAIALGLFLVAGILGIVVSMRQAYSAQDGLTQMQEGERFLLTVLDTSVHSAGYYPDPLVNTIATAFPATTNDGTVFAAQQFIKGTGAANGTDNDTLSVRFQAANNDGLTNCQGDTNTSGVVRVYTSSFSINALKQLVCTVSIDGQAPGASIVLADNVALMNIRYGIDTDGATDATRSADTYVPASAVTPANWQNVRSVQLRLTIVDLVNSTPSAPKALPYPLLHTITLMNK